MNTTTEEKTIKQLFVGKCWEYLVNYLLSDKRSEIQKSEVVRDLFKIKPPRSEVKVEIVSNGKKSERTFTIRHKRSDYPELKEWRKAVFSRDRYKCQECGKTGYLEAHHIKGWRDYPHLRFDIDNGSTLCRKCHKKTENYGTKRLRIL